MTDSTNGKAKVLLVEDEEDVLSALFFAVAGAGYSCKTARTGPEALMVAADWKPDLVLLDLTIPGLDGMEVCLRIKQAEQTANAKVVIVTGRSKSEAEFLSKECGADLYLTKPFNLDELLNSAKALLGMASEEQP